MASISQQGFLTCIACRLVFNNPQDQRVHYQTDLHRFNLRRQATNLPPVSAEVFQEKVQQQRAEEAKKQDKHTYFCGSCNKSFGSENTFRQHNASRKHMDRVRANGIPATSGAVPVVVPPPTLVPEPEKTEQELIDEKIKNAVTLTLEQCLFCPVTSASLEANLDHMTFEHGFFLPYIEYVEDLEGLIQYLGEKIGTGNTCLSCNKMFRTCEGVQKHMVMTNHCRIKWEDNEDEYIDWYDWERELEDDEDSDAPDTPPAKVAELAPTGYTIVLRDGSTIVHRDLAIYHKQRFKREETRESVLIQRLMTQYNTLGFVNPVGKFQTSVMKQSQRRDQHWHNKRDMQLGVKANKLQVHRREQIIF